MTGEARLLIDPYLDWVRREGLPVATGFGVDCLAVDVGPWPRLDARGAFVHVDGRGDFIDVQLLELAPGRATSPQRHLYEVVIYVLAGSGHTEIEADGARRRVEWGPKSLAAIPPNVGYRHRNSGRAPARLAMVTSLPVVLNLFRSESFVFDNPAAFSDRLGDEGYYRGEGRLLSTRPGRHVWESNFVPDVSTVPLQEWEARGAGGRNLMMVLADGTIHAHLSEMPVGTYKKAHRHTADFHIFTVAGEGYSLYWYEGDADFKRFDWRHGTVFAPADMMFHQHFNLSREPARYLPLAFGNLRYPFVEGKRRTWLGMDVSVKEGGRQIEYEDEDRRIRRLYEEELRRRGIPARMSEVLAVR